MAWTNPRVLRDPRRRTYSPISPIGDPAICEDARGRLHAVFHDRSRNKLRHLVSDSGELGDWRKGPGMPRLQIFGGFDAAVHGNHLHLVYQKSSEIRHARVRVTRQIGRWTDLGKVPNQLSKSRVSLASAGGTLHMIHHGARSNNVWHSWLGPHGWSQNVWRNNLTSVMRPIITSASDNLHLFTSLASGRVRHHEWYGRQSRWNAQGALPFRHRAGSGLALAGMPGVNEILAIRTNPPRYRSSRVINPNDPVLYARKRFADWSADAPLSGTAAMPGSVPATQVSGRSLHMLFVNNFGQLCHSVTRNRVVGEVRLVFFVPQQVLAQFSRNNRGAPARLAARVDQLVQGTNNLLSQTGLWARRTRNPTVLTNFPNDLLVLNTHNCLLNDVSTEQDRLFRLGQNLRRNEIAVHVVQNVTFRDRDGIAGCASPLRNACVVEPTVNPVVLAHEVGHVLGLTHVGNRTNLMFNGGLGANAINLTRGQGNRMLRDDVTVV